MKSGLLSLLVIVSLFNAIYAYTVVGTKVLDPSGNEVLLRGVDRPSMEWDILGEYISLADYTLMAGWGANVVRVALNQDYWFSSDAYKILVQQQATWINSLGMGVIFDLHWNNGGQQNMADLNSITFWSQMATTFKDNAWVMFELYNEPHDVSWSVWLNGDGSSYAGMQQLYNAVRAAGANNAVLVGGLNWAFDLSGVSSGYALTGTNIIYATHPYDYDGKQAANWDTAFGNLASSHPVMLTEFGQYCNSDGYVSTLLAYAQSKSLHWSAWGWYVSGCSFPSLINDWTGTPSEPVGVLVKSYLSGSSTASSATTTTGSKTAGTTSSAATSTTGTVSSATSSLQIYADGLLNSFQDWSWAASYSLTDATHVHSGTYAIKLVASAYGGVYFHTTSSFTLGSYSSLTFYVYSDSTLPASDFGIVFYDGSQTEITNIYFPSAVTGGVWTTITVPVSSISSTLTTQISGVAIQSKASANIGTIWIDDMSFVSSAQGTTTTAAVTTAAATTTTTTTTTAKGTTATTAAATTAKGTTATTAAATTATTAAATTSTSSKGTTTTTTTTAKSATTTSSVASTSTSAASSSTTAKASSTSSGCSASNIVITQTLSNSWSANGKTVNQYTVSIRSTCTTKTLSSLTLTASNWDPLGYWVATVSGTTLSFPSYVSVTSSSPYTGFGYQNYAGQATFTVNSFTFQ